MSDEEDYRSSEDEDYVPSGMNAAVLNFKVDHTWIIFSDDFCFQCNSSDCLG